MSNLRQGVRRERHIWKQEEENIVVELKELGESFGVISNMLRLKATSCKRKYYALKADQRAAEAWNESWNEELKRLVKIYGLRPTKIAKELSTLGMNVSIPFVKKKIRALTRQGIPIDVLTLFEPENGQKDLPETPKQMLNLQDLLLPSSNVASDDEKNGMFAHK